MKKKYKILVFDLGKTNKKISVFTDNLKLIASESTQIGEETRDDILSEKISEIHKWIFNSLRKISREHEISAIAATTFGATVVYLNNNGKLLFPVVSYMHQPADSIYNNFFNTFGSREKLYLRTATPPFSQLLNAGMGIYWFMKTFPEKFQYTNDKYVLTLPVNSSYCHRRLS